MQLTCQEHKICFKYVYIKYVYIKYVYIKYVYIKYKFKTYLKQQFISSFQIQPKHKNKG